MPLGGTEMMLEDLLRELSNVHNLQSLALCVSLREGCDQDAWRMLSMRTSLVSVSG